MWNGWIREKLVFICFDLCVVGFYLVYGSVMCCWKCVECENGFVKLIVGLDICEKCCEGYVLNK